MRLRSLALAAWMLVVVPALAVPPGYRYVGSRVVSDGRVVYWYWNADHVEIGPSGISFVAHMYARAADIGQERSYVAIVRCDLRAYRDAALQGAYEPIEDGEPIAAVWRAGCNRGIALQAAARAVNLDGNAPLAVPVAVPSSVVIAQAPAKSPPVPPEPADPRRADPCVRFAETRGAPAGDATVTNTCSYPVEITFCYKGGAGGPYDCATPPRGKQGDTLGPGTMHVLPEFRRGRNKGINVVACRGEPGTVFPRLDEAGKSGCF